MKPFLKIYTQPKANPLETGEYEEFIFYSCHKRYTFGPDSYKVDVLMEDMEETEFREMIKTVKGGSVYHSETEKAYYYPMFMLDHSGLAFSFAPFNDPWDSGLGAIVKVSDESVEKHGNSYKTFVKFKKLINSMNNFETEVTCCFMEIDLCTGDVLNGAVGFDIDTLNVESVREAFKDELKHEYTNYEYQYAIDHIENY